MYSNRFQRLTPYTPGEQPKNREFIKLNTNETPYPPCPEIRELLGNIDIEELRLYPDPQSEELREAIGKAEKVPPSRVFVSNGSDEALSFCFFAFFEESAGPVLFPDFTYSFYPVYCSFYNLPYRAVPLQPDFSLDIEAMLKAIPESSGVIFPNPNAPTGRYEELSKIEPIIRAAGKARALIIDEAYIDFGGESAVSLLDAYPNLVIVKTMSKGFSLAGARIGYTIAGDAVTSALFTVKDSFNSYPLDRISQKIGTAAISNLDYYREIQNRIIATRESTEKKLKGLGWEVVPSKANFLFAKHPRKTGKEVSSILRERGILVRRFNIPGIDNYIRITIGTDEEMERFGEVCGSDL